MKKTTIIALLSIAVSALSAKAPQGEGWIKLFNGETLAGWEICNGFAPYSVEDGAVVGRTAEASPNTFLKTKKMYDNFELQFEVKFSDGLNTGVQIRSRSREYGHSRFFGPQVEIEKSPGQAGFIYGEGLETGWLSEEPGSDDPAVNQHSHIKNGQWNHYRIIANGPHIETFINGQRVTKYTNPKLWRTYNEGSIGLQVHSIKPGTGPYEVRWKDIYLKELPPYKAPPKKKGKKK